MDSRGREPEFRHPSRITCPCCWSTCPRILLISTLSIHQGHLSRIFFPSHSPALRFVLACDGQCAGAFVMAGSLLGGA
jgi:hypothetical protein